MATQNEDIVFTASVDKSGEAAKSLKSMKQDYINLQAELTKTTIGTKAYYDTLVKLGAVKDDIGDLNATISALNPEGKVAAFQNVAGKLAGGFQAATGAVALFGGQSKELEQQLLKVQAATAFAEGIKSVTGLRDAFAVLGAVIKANPIYALASVIAAISAAMFMLSRNTRDLEAETKRQAATTAEAIKVYEREIELLEAQGASEQKIVALKKEKIALQIQEIEGSLNLQKEQLKEIKNNNTWYESLVAGLGFFEKANSLKAERAAEVNDKIKKSESEVADLKNSLLVEEAKVDKKAADDSKKRAEEEEKLREERIKRFQDFLAGNQKSQEEYDAFIAEENAKKHEQELIDFENQLKSLKEIEDRVKGEESDAQDQRIKEDLDNYKSAQEEKIKLAEHEQKVKGDILDKGVQSGKALSDAFFGYQLSRAKGNAAEELKIRKKQFDVDKAFSITRTVIDGVRSVQVALTLPPPLSYALAAANGILAVANVLKIASTKFDAGSTSADTGAIATPAAAPNIQTAAPTIQPTTRLDEQGNNLTRPQPVRAYMVETDVTDSTTRVKRLEDQASFP